jgi:hypothetical protein
MNKKPWLAALLNFFFFGAGYIYNGKRTGLGWGLLAGIPFMRYGEINIFLTKLVPTYWAILFTGLVIFQITLAYDAYKEAKQGIAG